jgi:hypothetical protein
MEDDMLPLQRIKPIDIPTMHEELQERLRSTSLPTSSRQAILFRLRLNSPTNSG